MKRTIKTEQYTGYDGSTVTTLHIPADLWESYWRNEFAARAMQGILSSQSLPTDAPIADDILVSDSFHAADAMIAEMKRREGENATGD